MAYQLINLGNGTYGAHDTATGMARSFSSEANAKQFLGVPNIDYTKAVAPTFDFNQLLGANADKLINVASKVTGPTNPTPNVPMTPSQLPVGSPSANTPLTPSQLPLGTPPMTPSQPLQNTQPLNNPTSQPLNTPQSMPAATTQNLAQGGIQGLIGTRKSAINPNVDEYFNTQTGQGFADPASLFDFVSKQTGQKISSFDQVGNLMKTSPASSNLDGASSQSSDAGSATSAATGATGDGAGGVKDTPPQTAEDNTVKTYTDNYNKILTDLGLPTLKTTIDDTAKALNDINDKKLEEAQSINDNPWLDENTRQKSLTSLDQKYQGKLALQTGLLTLYNNQYTNGITQANTIMGDVTADMKLHQENAQKALEANQKIVLDYGVNQPFYTIDGQTMIRSSDGKVYSNYQDWVKDGGGADKFQMIGGLMSIKDQKQFQIDLQNANTAASNASQANKNKISYQDINGKTYQITTDTNGNIISSTPLDQLPGVTPPEQSQYQIETNTRILSSVDALSGLVSNDTVGLGGKVKGSIPGTSAYNFKAQLDTLKSNIAFGALTAMREASKTGGALGQISDAEERLLSSTLGALDVGQSPEAFKTQLQKIKDSITRWNQAAQSQTGNSGNSGGGIIEYNSKLYQTDANGNFDPNSPLTSVGKTSASIPTNQTASRGTLALARPNPNNVIAGFDLTTYATDPNHERNVRAIYNKVVSTVSSEQNLEAYIQKTAKGSPIKASYVTQAAKQYNVDPYLMVAIMQQDSSLGTKGKAVGTKNPGNVGNTDSGATQGFNSWLDGVLAVAKNLSKRRVGPMVPNNYA